MNLSSLCQRNLLTSFIHYETVGSLPEMNSACTESGVQELDYIKIFLSVCIY